MNRPLHYTWPLLVVALTVYLGVSAPPPLPDGKSPAGAVVPVKVLFDALASEQAAARATYTEEIVGPGLKAGLKFSESWQAEGVEAGPLPALLLRETSQRLQRANVEVGLFLGSDYPIAEVNRFKGQQVMRFEEMKRTGAPQHFQEPSTAMFTSMYIDPAVAPACVSCHNDHPSSPKRDWKLNDPMGATTWQFPRGEVTAEEVVERVAALRRAVRGAYEAYLARAARFEKSRVEIGEKWPREGMYLPDADHFMQAVKRRSSERTLSVLLEAAGGTRAQTAPK